MDKIRTIANRDVNGVIFEKIYEIVFYDDSFLIKLNFLSEGTDGFLYSYILHDKDVDSDGVLKKPHYHVLIKYKNRVRITSVSKFFDVPENYIEWKSNHKASIQYLIHQNNSNKYHYDSSELHSNFDHNLYLIKTSEPEEVRILLDFIYRCTPTIPELSQFALDNNLWGTFRRNYRIILDIFDVGNINYRLG